MSEPLALVTGASRGLGFALAEALAPAFHVVAVARTVGGLEDLDDRIREKGGSATLAPMDITVDAAMQQLCRSIFDRWGRLDLWIHTAIHASPLTPAPHMDMGDWEKSVATNIHATGRLIAYVAPLLGEEGRAVFFDDPLPEGRKFFADYAASKAAQIALARAWAAETERLGPRIDIVTPRPMPTALRARFFPGEKRGNLADIHEEAARILGDLDLKGA